MSPNFTVGRPRGRRICSYIYRWIKFITAPFAAGMRLWKPLHIQIGYEPANVWITFSLQTRTLQTDIFQTIWIIKSYTGPGRRGLSPDVSAVQDFWKSFHDFHANGILTPVGWFLPVPCTHSCSFLLFITWDIKFNSVKAEKLSSKFP